MTRTVAHPSSGTAAVPKTMAAAVIHAPGRLRVVQAPLPTPQARQVRIRIEGCGVCASNVPPWEGREWFNYPLRPGELGHEAWGVVTALGSGVDATWMGQRVGVLSGHAYADFDIADVDSLVPLPASLGNQPFPAEPLGCAMNIFRRSAVRSGQNIAIIGIGFLGALLTRLCATAGANVIAISRRSGSLDIARQFGAEHLLRFAEPWRLTKAVQEITGGRLCERVIEATGKQEALDVATELCGEYGRLIIAGYHQDGQRHINMQLWNWRGLDIINAHERDPAIYRQGMQEAVAAVASGRIAPRLLYTHAFGLEELDQALELTRTRPEGFIKALVLMDGTRGRP